MQHFNETLKDQTNHGAGHKSGPAVRWNLFAQTGAVEDYLSYRHAIAQEQ